ncbi:hypothetical protein HDU98_000377 [Podochytrium sp. JEL0797]|nr:hypothetical protein HDU98_000377 [Podochytrium sp. JEL0797]
MNVMEQFESVMAAAPAFAKHLLDSLYTQHTWSSQPGNLGNCPMDHICLRVGTTAEYEQWKHFLSNHLEAELLIESLIAGRPIATFKLQEKDAITVVDNQWTAAVPEFGSRKGFRSIRVIELPSPKPGSYYPTGWEHAEFALQANDQLEARSMTEGERVQRALECLDRFEMNDLNKEVAFNKKSFQKGTFNVDLRWDPHPKEEWSVKFHWLPLEHVIAIEKANK